MSLKRFDGMRKGVALLPNLLTTANLFCGFFAIIQAISGRFVFAVWLILLAGLFDFLDGRVARMTGTQSDFGVEYDSLADMTTFCLAPALLMYRWGLAGFGKFGIAASFLYFACGALRLARFNVQAAGVEKTDFQGLPSPAAAATLTTFLLFYTSYFGKSGTHNVFGMILIISLGLLMVSEVRYKSMKQTKKRTSFFYLICVIAGLFVVLSRPEMTLFGLGIGYVTLGILQHVYFFFRGRPGAEERRQNRKNRQLQRKNRRFRDRTHTNLPVNSDTELPSSDKVIPISKNESY